MDSKTIEANLETIHNSDEEKQQVDQGPEEGAQLPEQQNLLEVIIPAVVTRLQT